MPQDDKVSLGFLDEVPVFGGANYAEQSASIRRSILTREVKAAAFLSLIEILKINPRTLEDKAALFDRMKGVASLGFSEIAINIKTN